MKPFHLDNLIKIWCATLSEKTLLFSLRSTISLSVGSPCHIRMIPYHQRQTKLAVVSNQQFLFVYTLDGEGLVFGAPKTHEHDDDHGKEITSIVGLSSLSIFATSSLDGTVKIWDGEENTLIREIQFQEPVNSVCFNNARGDLIVGLSNQVGLVRMQDYLPYNLLRLAIDLDHRDDALELSIMFDGSIDFWGLYRQMLLSSSSRTAPIWHVLDKPEAERGMAKGNKDPFSILSNEEYVRRKAVIHNRKMRRLFLLKERHAYESAKSFEPVTVFTDVAIPIMNSQDNSRSDLSSRASVRSLRTAESKKKLFNGRKLAKLAGDSRVNDEEEEGEGMSEFVNFRPSFAMVSPPFS